MVTKKTTGNLAKLRVRAYGADRNILDGRVLIRVTDGEHNQIFMREVATGDVTLSLKPQDNYIDDLTVLVTSDGFDLQGFFPVKISADFTTTCDIMLLPQHPQFQFLEWGSLSDEAPEMAKLLAAGTKNDTDARARYEDLILNKQEVAACMFNIMAAMEQILLKDGSALDRLVQMDWSAENARDRFFAWCTQDLLNASKAAATGPNNKFDEEKNPGVFHPGATCSYKQNDFGEANVQLTFHEGDTKTINGVPCLKVELDIDYYKDLLAHALMEVLENKLTHRLTDPRQAYVLRWIAGRQAGRPEFNPPYAIIPGE